MKRPRETDGATEVIASPQMAKVAATKGVAVSPKVSEKSAPLTTSFGVSPSEYKINRLQRIVRENHLNKICDVAFNRCDNRFNNLVATAGCGQVNIYDNENGKYKHLDIMMNYTHPGSEPKPDKGDDDEGNYLQFTRVQWMTPATDDGEDDAWVVAGAENGETLVISMTKQRVIMVMKGRHSKAIRDIAIHPRLPNVIMTSCPERVCLWDASMSCECIGSFDIANNGACFHEFRGTIFVLYSSDNTLRRFAVPFKRGKLGIHGFEVPETDRCGKFTAKRPIDCIVSLMNGTVVVKDEISNTYVIDGIDYELQHQFKAMVNYGESTRCGVSTCERFLCCCFEGKAALYDIENGVRLTTLEYHRSRNDLLSCAFSPNGRNIIAVDNMSFIWRWDLCAPKENMDGDIRTFAKGAGQQEN